MIHARTVGGRLGIVIVILVLGGCDFTQTLDVSDRGHESRLVLQGWMQTRRPLRVAVSRSVGAFEPGEIKEERFSVTDATVALFRRDRRLGSLSRDTLNLYSTDGVTLSAGTSYTIRASAPGLDPVEATDRIPVLPPTRLMPDGRDGDERTLQLRIEDPRAVANQYRIALWEVIRKEDGERFRYKADFETQNPAVVRGAGQQTAGTYDGHDALFSDDLFDGESYRVHLEVDAGDERREAYVLLLEGLSAEAYRYRRLDNRASETGDGPFAEPVDVEGNVPGGYGLVGGRAVDTLRYRVRASRR